MKYIFTPEAQAPGGHYSQAIESGGFVFVSGVIPNKDQIETLRGDIEAQVRSVLTSCRKILAAAGCSLENVVQSTAYIVGAENWGAFNRVYSEFFGDHKPARAVVPVPELHYGFLVEVQMIASKHEK